MPRKKFDPHEHNHGEVIAHIFSQHGFEIEFTAKEKDWRFRINRSVKQGSLKILNLILSDIFRTYQTAIGFDHTKKGERDPAAVIDAVQFNELSPDKIINTFTTNCIPDRIKPIHPFKTTPEYVNEMESEKLKFKP